MSGVTTASDREDLDVSVRRQALNSLGQIESPAAMASLLRYRSSTNLELRSEAIVGISRRGGEVGLDELFEVALQEDLSESARTKVTIHIEGIIGERLEPDGAYTQQQLKKNLAEWWRLNTGSTIEYPTRNEEVE